MDGQMTENNLSAIPLHEIKLTSELKIELVRVRAPPVSTLMAPCTMS